MKFNTILESIGRTPCVRLGEIFGKSKDVWLKLERANPGGSIKDRIALSMIEEAENSGIIKPGTVIIEPTSGNTGIGLAMVCAVKKYPLILVMPESMSVERRRIMQAYGATLELTPKEKRMPGAIDRAVELLKEHPNSWMPMQFENPANTEVHKRTTAKEILEDFPEGLDYIITGVGTGGHITACAEVLKSYFPNLKVLAVEPEKSAALSGGTVGSHKLQGIGAGFIPKILNREALDGVITVNEEEAFLYTKRLAREEGIFVGLSSGAAVAAVAKHVSSESSKKVLTFCYDTGERYLSLDDLF